MGLHTGGGTDEFAEIAHSGGLITFSFNTDDEGRRGFQIRIQGSRPVPMAMTSLWALPDGIPVATLSIVGMGMTIDPPPISGCLPVYIQSDSEGYFGHNCPACGKYWRSGPWPAICPYCALREEGHNFLSEAQLRFVRMYCAVLNKAAADQAITDIQIDMDEVADAVGKQGPKPEFFVSERSQQRRFTCGACEEENDILGDFGYCSLCGTRNDLMLFETVTMPGIRLRLNSGMRPEQSVKDAIGAFDSFVSQYAKQLAARMPMVPERKHRLTTKAFHELNEMSNIFNQWFGIDLCRGMKEPERAATARLFHRRHVYEHCGGEADQKYIDASGDTSVMVKQALRESKEGMHNLLGSLLKMASNLHDGFHILFPPNAAPIEAFATKKKRMTQP